MDKTLRIGTRESQLAVWQATQVQRALQANDINSELVYIKSDGDIDLQTPLYEMGVQGVFTKTLDAALLNNRVDIAVHSMKDVPTQLAKGLQQAAVMERASYKDLLVFGENAAGVPAALGYVNGDWTANIRNTVYKIATSSVRRKAQWLNRYPNHEIDNLRGNVNTRLQKLKDSDWQGAIFAAAGLERIGLRPESSVELDWMLPAPAQGAIMIVCRSGDTEAITACAPLNHEATAICTRVEKDFLRVLMGGCATPISALAQIDGDIMQFEGNILSLDGTQKVEINLTIPVAESEGLGVKAAEQLIARGAGDIIRTIRNAAE